MYGLCLVEKAVRHVRPFEGLWNTAIYLSSTSSSSLSFIHTVQVHAQRKMKYSYARTYREQNSRDYNNWNIRFLNQRATAEVARTFFNLGSFSSMYNQRDNVLFCLRGGGAHTSIPRDKAYSSSPLLPCSPAPLLPFIYVLCLDWRCWGRSRRWLMSCPLAREFYIHSV